MKFHLLYTTKDKKFHDEEREFDSFPEAEIWLVYKEAINWEIGIPEIQPNPGEVPESEVELFLTILNDERDGKC